jgi:hypothetical protein
MIMGCMETRPKVRRHWRAAVALAFFLNCGMDAHSQPKPEAAGENPLLMPPVGWNQLRIISPTVLELTLITTKRPDPAPVEQWNFVRGEGQLQLPKPEEFKVVAGGRSIPVERVGFKRRVLYAPLKQRDLRIGNYLYLQLGSGVPENAEVSVSNPGGKLWAQSMRWEGQGSAHRLSPAIHVNQVGYPPAAPKKAMIGHFMGSLGELTLANENATFAIIDTRSGNAAHQGKLKRRPDEGYTFDTYQQVYEADFSDFQTPGEYRLQVPGLGVSFPFFIGEGVAGMFARTYALGLYHQRCGTSNELPYTRFQHGPCHTAPAEVPVPISTFSNAWKIVAQRSADATNTPKHTARILKSDDSMLYPFMNKGKVDVAGGHHDAGDYSKYTANSAGLIHHLMTAVDAFPGVAELDNLGLPESGDGKGDLLQEAKWEADFLAKMQDADGGFYFLVYPRDRAYENNVLPDEGDPQIVYPKTTAATAAAVAALAQCASSPHMKRQFPEAASMYLGKARKGWEFLEKAIAKHGKDGAYQKITHYGHPFMHDDELAWAACEMFLATKDPKIHGRLLEWLNPADPNTRKWSWWRLYEAWGCAIRSYALAERAGKAAGKELDISLLKKAEAEVIAGAEDHLKRARASAYGTSFPLETKRVRAGGWYFGEDAAFDLAVASQLEYPQQNDPRQSFMDALLGNMNYVGGCNPVNVAYLTGIGWKRQRDIVHHYAQNDHRVLPPVGIPIGNIHAGFMWLDHYQKELGALSFPSDGDKQSPYPFYDRWGDSHNLQQEFVLLHQGRGVAAAAWLMAQTSLRDQKWKPELAAIRAKPGGTSATLHANVDLGGARIVWEAKDHEPSFGETFTASNGIAPKWIEAEAQLPDGRFVFATTNLSARPQTASKTAR